MTQGSDRPRIHLDVQNLRLARGERRVFENLSCTFPYGAISVILGSSGAGKTSLLRMMGCLDKPDRGEIWVDGETELTRMPEHQAKIFRRGIGMMFQNGALLDSLPVFDNVALPVREHTSRSEERIAEDVGRIFQAVDLVGVDELLPGQLSGGMMKRAALARALIMAPDILLCDEPFSGLDPSTLRLVESLLVSVNRRFDVTMIITSHDIASTLRMADWIVLLTDGSAISGLPDEMRRSSDRRVREFFADEQPDEATR